MMMMGMMMMLKMKLIGNIIVSISYFLVVVHNTIFLLIIQISFCLYLYKILKLH